jgi:Flp pilus assembly protein TadD
MVEIVLRNFCLLSRLLALSILLLCGLCSILHAEEERPLLLAARGSLNEEDLPYEESSVALPEQLPAASLANPGEPRIKIPKSPAVPSMPPADGNSATPALPPSATLSPQDLAALRFIEDGKADFDREEWDHAQEQFERALSLAPLQPYGYYFLGRIAFNRGEHKQAVAFLRKAELLFAPTEYAWRGETAGLLGAVYEDMGDYVQARTAYQRCLQLAPRNLKAMSALARLAEDEPLSNDFPPSNDFLPQ